jgi:CSLREA domain-containing protein
MAITNYFRVSSVVMAVLAAALLALVMTHANPASALSATAVSGTTIIVDTDEDESNTDGDCSLREAITAADTNAAVDGCAAGSATERDAIHFSLGDEATVVLGSELPSVTDPSGLNINGLRADITISGNDAVRVLQVGAGAKLTLANLTVADGNAGVSTGVFGGGVLNNGGTLRVDHSTFSGNSAFFGGGIQNFNGTLKVIDTTFSDNSASEGGGIRNGGGTLEVTDSTFSSNSSTGNPGFGGGILNNGPATVTRSTLSNNSTATASGSGGGIYNEGATLTVINSTLSGNNNGGNTSGSGGIHNNNGTLNVINSTFSNNGVRDAGVATTLSNTILANVPSGNNCVGTVTDDGYNISDDGSCNFTDSTSKNNTDPKLAGSLANNGGPTQTIALLQGSPAINAIPKATNGCGTEIKTDQRGVKRPQGPGCEIGAFEKKVRHR